MDDNSTYFPFNELLFRYEHIQMKITSRKYGERKMGEYMFIWKQNTKEIWIQGHINSINIWHGKIPHNLRITIIPSL